MASKKIYPSEDQEQMEVVKWLELHNIKFTAIPNSTFSGAYVGRQAHKNWSHLAKLKRLGVRKGFPDLICLMPKGIVCIEMKRVSGSACKKPEQLEWIEALNKYQGVEARMCRGAADAIKYLNQFLPCQSENTRTESRTPTNRA